MNIRLFPFNLLLLTCSSTTRVANRIASDLWQFAISWWSSWIVSSQRLTFNHILLSFLPMMLMVVVSLLRNCKPRCDSSPPAQINFVMGGVRSNVLICYTKEMKRNGKKRNEMKWNKKTTKKQSLWCSDSHYKLELKRRLENRLPRKKV